jgi:hypothetical protein
MRGDFFGVTVIVCTLLAACANTAEQGGNSVDFLRERSTDAPDMAALLGGTLTLIDGCLRLRDGTDEGYAAIWPFSYGFRVEGDNVSIIGAEGQVVARVGHRVWVSGGEVPLSAEALEEIVATGPVRCTGPYWRVATIEEPLNP